MLQTAINPCFAHDSKFPFGVFFVEHCRKLSLESIKSFINYVSRVPRSVLTEIIIQLKENYKQEQHIQHVLPLMISAHFTEIELYGCNL